MSKVRDIQKTWRSESLDDTAAPVRVIGDRWVLGEELGRGGFGRVLAAVDRHTGADVAVKLLDRVPSSQRPRLERELHALRLLKHPGVVRLLADLPLGDGHCIVMERLPNVPFPGSRRSDWDGLASGATGLFQALAYIHDQGIIHRDLKPGNVLMRGTQPVLLDFGLARGGDLGSTITRSGTRMGTLRYMSPEQGSGERVTLQTDLYSAALMLYEVLTGQLPHPGVGSEDQLRARLVRAATPIREHRPDLPASVASTIDRLLAREPSERPADAHAVLALFGEDTAPGLPWLGDAVVFETLRDALDAGRSFTIFGAPGSGRSRILQEVAATRSHHWLQPGHTPFESMGPILEHVDLAGAQSGDEARSRVQAVLNARLGDGAVLLVDEVRLDWSTQQLLERHEGPVLRVAAAPGQQGPDSIVLEPLSEAQLRPLFRGPDRVLHLREDGAMELHRRTGGHPERVVREVTAWQRAGLATRVGDAWTVDRKTLDHFRSEAPARCRAVVAPVAPLPLPSHLDRLLRAVVVAGAQATPAVLSTLARLPSWQLDETLAELEARGLVQQDGQRMVAVGPVSRAAWTAEERVEVHAALADLIPQGTKGRLQHLVEGGVQTGLVEEALSACRTMERSGLLSEARSWLSQTVRSAPDDPVYRPVLEAHVRLALDASDRGALRDAVALLRQRPIGAGRQLLELADAIAALLRDDAAAALDHLQRVPAFADRHLEAQRIRHLQLKAERRMSGSDTHTLHEVAAEAWPAPWPRIWSALVAYRKPDLRAAALALEAAADVETRAAHRVRDQLRAASAWSMVGELDRTMALAEEGLAEARSRRLSVLELRAEWTRRMVAHKRGETVVDWELVQAAETLSRSMDDAGLVALTEAYIAYQGQDLTSMTSLARLAVALLQDRGLAGSVQMATGLVAAGEGRWADLQALAGDGDSVVCADLLVLLDRFGQARSADTKRLRMLSKMLSESDLDQVGMFKLGSNQ